MGNHLEKILKWCGFVLVCVGIIKIIDVDTQSTVPFLILFGSYLIFEGYRVNMINEAYDIRKEMNHEIYEAKKELSDERYESEKEIRNERYESEDEMRDEMREELDEIRKEIRK